MKKHSIVNEGKFIFKKKEIKKYIFIYHEACLYFDLNYYVSTLESAAALNHEYLKYYHKRTSGVSHSKIAISFGKYNEV